MDERFPPWGWLRKAYPSQARDIERVWGLYREFGEECVAPAALALDDEHCPDFAQRQRELLSQACRRRLFSATLPVVYGGLGLPLLGVLPGLEELSRHCAGIANLVSVHGLALALVSATGNLRILGELSRGLVASERLGEPELIATAVTEPSAGTDVENVELLSIAKLECQARPVVGGYVLNGRKVFISNGSLARHVIVLMPTERAAAAATMKAFWVRAGSPGFVVENVELKMGQRACPAATLGFFECFVPDQDCVGPIGARELDLVLGATRGAVAAYAAGIATAALDRSVGWAERSLDRWGRPFIEGQGVRQRIAEIQQHAWQAREAYWTAAAANDRFGLSSLVSGSRERAQHWLPRRLADAEITRALLASGAAQATAQLALSALPEWKVSLAAAWGAAAKVSASELAVSACELALEITGSAGLRRQVGIEKLLRDAKLLQIYEGTNELNRLEVFSKVRGTPLLTPHSLGRSTAAPAPDLMMAGTPRPVDDPELEEMVRAVERWLTARGAAPARKRSARTAEAVVPGDLAELMALGAPQLSATVDGNGSLATPAQMAHVLVAFGRSSPVLGIRLLAHWVAAALAPDAAGQCHPDTWLASPLFDSLWNPANRLRLEHGSNRLRGRIELVVAADHAETLVLPLHSDESAAPRWCRIQRSLPGVRVSPPIVTHGLTGMGACDVDIDLDWNSSQPMCYPTLTEPAVERASVSGWAVACAVGLCLGVLEASAAATSEHVGTRWQGGNLLIDHDAVGEMVGDVGIELARTSSTLSALLGPSLTAPARLGLLLGARAAVLRGTEIGIRALGGYGYLVPYSQEARHRDARQLCEVLGGTSELRLQLRDLLRGHA